METVTVEKQCTNCDGSGFILVNNGKWIRERREADNMTLREAARQLGISAAYLSDIELGKRNASAKLMKFFADL